LIHFVSPDIFCHRLLYAFFDDFQYSLFDFPHLSSFNACEELDHLIILYPLSPALMSIGGHCPPQLLWWRRPWLRWWNVYDDMCRMVRWSFWSSL